MLVSFALVPLTIGYVSAELYGVWLSLSSIISWVGFMDLGFALGLKNKLTEALAIGDMERGKTLVSTTYAIMALVFIPVCLILEFIVPTIDWVGLLNVSPCYSDDIVRTMHALVALCCLQFISNVIISVIAAYQQVALSNSFLVIGNIISLIIIVILTKTAEPSLWAMSLVFSLSPIVVTIVASFILFSGKYKEVSPDLRYAKKEYIKDIFSLGYKFFIINFQVLVLHQTTNILIANVSSPIDVTNYNIAYKYLNIAMLLFSMIFSPLWPAYSDAYAKKDFVWMEDNRKKMNRILLLSIGLCMLFVALSKPFYWIWLGNNVEVPFMMTLMVSMYVSAFGWVQMNTAIINGIGKVKFQTCLAVIGMILHIPCSFFYSRFIGVYGVLLSMILINLVFAILYHIQLNKILSGTAKGIWDK